MTNLFLTVYMPISEADDEEVDSMYNQINQVYEDLGKSQVRMIMMAHKV